MFIRILAFKYLIFFQIISLLLLFSQATVKNVRLGSVLEPLLPLLKHVY